MSFIELLLSVRGLRKSFGDNEVLCGIDLEVRCGQVVALIGLSGSGKTIVLRTLNSLEVFDGGNIMIGNDLVVDFDCLVGKQQLDLLRDCSAMVFQHYNLFPHMTVLDNVIEGLVCVRKQLRADAVAEVERLLARVGLTGKHDAYFYELSGGQQQWVGIVCALVMRLQVLLFDELMSFLDLELVGDVLAVIKELSEEGWTMVIVTHELAFAREVADEVVFMDQGWVVERGALAQVLGSPQQERIQQFVRRLQQRF